MKTLRNFLLLCSGALMLTTACKKEEATTSMGTTPVKVRMTDAPANYDQVNVDIIGVEFNMSSGAAVSLETTPGVYNLLDFANGANTLIASADVPSGELSQVRLILGPNNSIVVNGESHPLETPSAMQSGLKINVHNTLQPGVPYELLLDFDANQSIVVEGNGTYKLKPVLRVVNTVTSGSIHANLVTTVATPATVTATNNVTITTYGTVTAGNGHLLLQGLPEGTYTVTVAPNVPFAAVTITNVNVRAGAVTELGPIAL